MQQSPSPDTLLQNATDSVVGMDSLVVADSVAGADTTVAEVEEVLAEGQTRTFSQPADTWLFLVLTFLTLYIGLQRLWAYGEFRKRIRAMFNLRLANQYFREEESERGVARVVYDAWYLMAYSLAGYFLVHYLARPAHEIAPFALFAVVLAAVLSLYIIKRLLTIVLSALFEFGPLLRQFQYHDHIQHYLAALFLMPLLWVAAFAGSWLWPAVVWTIMMVLVVAFLLRYIRGLTLVFPSIRGFGFPFILYICTLEIAPVVAVVKGLDILFWMYLS